VARIRWGVWAIVAIIIAGLMFMIGHNAGHVRPAASVPQAPLSVETPGVQTPPVPRTPPSVAAPVVQTPPATTPAPVTRPVPAN
jgi:hypothetical protein